MSLAGEIDMATLPQLHDALLRAIVEQRGATVVVDLDGVFACDDAALGVMLGAAGRARESGGELVAVCHPGPLRSRLARNGFDRAVTVADTIASVAPNASS